MKTIKQLSAHRESIYRAYLLVREAIPAELLADVAYRVSRHDIDKYDAIARSDSVAYALHDFRADHHLCNWLVNACIPDAAFVEHVLDHVAVNMDRMCDQLFQPSWFHESQVFRRDDISGLLEALGPVTAQIREDYRAKVFHFNPFLTACSTLLR
jgi:hypothetical protein